MPFPYIFTFYSFKGGVGRSLALLNVAYTLAGRGRHVLVVDMDLEAPGISGFLQRHEKLAAPSAAHPLDILSLLGEAIAALPADGDLPEAARNLPPVGNYASTVPEDKLAPLRPKLGQLGRLDVLGPGPDYVERFGELRLKDLPQERLIDLSSLLHHYFKAQRFLHRPLGLASFDASVSTPYDYVLVDSRTGFTEIGGLCVGPLADRLVVITGLNDQNIQGTLAFLKEAGIKPKSRPKEAEPWDEDDSPEDSTDNPSLGPKPTILVASPVPIGEIGYKRERLKDIEKLLGIRPVSLTYHPQLALIESVFVRDFPEEYLAGEYLRLAGRIMAQVRDDPPSLVRRSRVLGDERTELAAATACLFRLASQEADLGAALLGQFANSAKPSTDDDRLAIRQLHAFLSQYPATRPGALNNWGATLSNQARTQKGQEADQLLGEAADKFEAALKIKPNYPEALNNWGNVRLDQARTKEGAEADRLLGKAVKKYAAALDLKPDYPEALSNWGSALLFQAKTKEGQETGRRLLREAREKLLEAERIRTGSGSYNLACVEALEGNVLEAVRWLTIRLSSGPRLTRKEIEADADFDSVRREPEFVKFVQSLPEK